MAYYPESSNKIAEPPQLNETVNSLNASLDHTIGCITRATTMVHKTADMLVGPTAEVAEIDRGPIPNVHCTSGLVARLDRAFNEHLKALNRIGIVEL